MLAAACTASKPARPPGAAPAKVATGRLPAGPDAPQHGLPIPGLDVPWEPPQVVAGDVGALQTAVANSDRLAVFTGPRLTGPVWPARIGQLIAGLSPQTEVTSTTSRGRAVFFGNAKLPLRRTADAPPRYDVAGLVLTAPATQSGLLIDDAGIDPAAWRALPAHAVGSCEPAFEALASGQEQSLAYLEPFLDHADAVLWQVYRAQLDALLPELEEAMAPYVEPPVRSAFDSPAAFEAARCGHAYAGWLTAYRACMTTDGRCAVAPRIYLIGGARIGSAEPSAFIDDSCDEKVGRNVVEELREAGREAADAAVGHLDLEWTTLADRLGAVTEVHDALEDLCTPRRRRFAAADIDAARSRLARIGRALAADDTTRPRGQWEVVDSQFFVPGVGPVFQLAQFRPGNGSPREGALSDARALRQFVLSRALCRSGYGDLPLAAVLLDEGADAPAFLGYFYEEELFCADLPPRLPSASASASSSTPRSPEPPPPAPPPPT